MVEVKKEDVLIEPKDIKPTSGKFEVIGTYNPAAIRLPNEDIVLYMRVLEILKKNESKDYYYVPRFIGEKKFEMKLDRFYKKDVTSKSKFDILFGDGTKRLFFISHLRRVVLDKTGFKIKSIDSKPSFPGLKTDGELGIEDPRIVKLGDRYVMTYVSLSRQGNVSTSFAISEDCLNWKRKGTIFSEMNKDVVLFPEMVRGNYYIFNRPEGGFEFTPPHVWMSTSKDLINWGRNRPLKLAKKGEWDYDRVGAGAPPLKTEAGWLLLYHGAIDKKEEQSSGAFKEVPSYEVGAALLNLKNPRKIIAKARKPIIAPERKYEYHGIEDKHVVFPTGLVRDRNDKYVLLFSGGGDRVVTVKKIALKDIIDSMERV